jgi:hypothetical protein
MMRIAEKIAIKEEALALITAKVWVRSPARQSKA